MTAVRGYCPMGCGQTLVLGSGGHVTCSLIGCLDPSAVDTILGDAETEHVVTLTARDFTILHPLRERLGDALLSCTLHVQLAQSDGPPAAPGRYRVAGAQGDGWHWSWVPS